MEHLIINLIYEAALSNEWNLVLDSLVKFTNSDAGVYISYNESTSEECFTFFTNFPDNAINNYNEKEKLLDMIIHKNTYPFSGSVVYLDGENYKNGSISEKLFYMNCIIPSGYRYMMGILIETEEKKWTVLKFCRKSSHKAYSENDSISLKNIIQHLSRALKVHRSMEEIKNKPNIESKILENIPMGIFIIDNNKSIIYENKYALELKKTNDLLRFNNKFSINHDDYSKEFDNIILKSFHKNIISESNLILDNKDKFKSLRMIIKNFKNNDFSYGRIFIIYILPFKYNYSLPKSHMIKVYNLTNREIIICEQFMNGFTLKEISDNIGSTMSSLRTYFKNIYEKVSCSSHQELMCFLALQALRSNDII